MTDLEEISRSTAADITELKCVLCVCPHIDKCVRCTHTVHHFVRADYIYIYDVLIQWLPFVCRKKKCMSEKNLWLINPAKEIKRGLDKFWV